MISCSSILMLLLSLMLLGEKKPKEEVHQKQRLGCTNFDLDNIVMLVDVKKLEQLLVKSEYFCMD